MSSCITRFVRGTIIATAAFFVGVGVAAVAGGTKTGESPLRYEHAGGEPAAAAKLLVLRVSGPIVGEESGGASALLPGRGVSGYRIQELLEKAAKDPTVKGVQVRFETPGGTIHGARAIFDGIKAYRERTGRPVVAHVEGMSASGGVLAMVGAAEIDAEPGSLIGSIGVTMGALAYYDTPIRIDQGVLGGGVETRNGIRSYPLVAGRSKDIGNPYREPTDLELATLRGMLQGEYDSFVGHVAAARGIEPTVIRDEMGAMIYGTREAMRFKLIDAVRTRGESLAHLAALADLQAGGYAVVRVADGRSLLSGVLGLQGGPPVPADRAAGMDACLQLAGRLLALHGDAADACR